MGAEVVEPSECPVDDFLEWPRSARLSVGTDCVVCRGFPGLRFLRLVEATCSAGAAPSASARSITHVDNRRGWDISRLGLPGLSCPSSRALASWSGQDVPLSLQSMPRSHLMTSATSIPSNRDAMPCRFPSQPSMNSTRTTFPASSVKNILYVQTPSGVKIFFSMRIPAMDCGSGVPVFIPLRARAEPTADVLGVLDEILVDLIGLEFFTTDRLESNQSGSKWEIGRFKAFRGYLILSLGILTANRHRSPPSRTFSSTSTSSGTPRTTSKGNFS